MALETSQKCMGFSMVLKGETRHVLVEFMGSNLAKAEIFAPPSCRRFRNGFPENNKN
jgi:hypothetical protein